MLLLLFRHYATPLILATAADIDAATLMLLLLMLDATPCHADAALATP